VRFNILDEGYPSKMKVLHTKIKKTKTQDEGIAKF
jgi:hypothetical protein